MILFGSHRGKVLSSKLWVTCGRGCYLSTAEDRHVRYKPAIVEEPVEDDDDFDLGPGDGEHPGEEVDPRLVLSRRLLQMGRSSYKHTERLPDSMMQKRSQISAYRTAPQIRRCLQDWMIKVDRETNARFREKEIGWKVGPVNPEKAANIFAYGAEETIAYAHYFLPPRYSIARKVFLDLKALLPGFKPTRVVDMGCGPGTCGAAAVEVFGDKVVKYAGIDISRSMLEAAQIMMEGTKVEAVFWDKTADVVQRARDRGERYDLAIASYTLSELTHDNSRRAAVQVLYELLDEGGVLVLIEQGNPVGSHIVRSARKFILDNFNDRASELRSIKPVKRFPGTKLTTSPKKDESVDPVVELLLPAPRDRTYRELRAAVIAPCSHDDKCPLARGVFCSFSQKVMSGVIRQDSEEKFSYVVIQKTTAKKTSASVVSEAGGAAESNTKWLHPRSESSDALPTPLDVLTRVMACRKKSEIPRLVDDLLEEVDWEEYVPPLYRNEWSRIVRSPIKANGHITFDVCAPTGRIVRQVLAKSSVKAIPSLFVALRKTTWGGLLPYMEGGSHLSPFSVEGMQRKDIAAPTQSQAQQSQRESGQVRLKQFGEVPDKDFINRYQARPQLRGDSERMVAVRQVVLNSQQETRTSQSNATPRGSSFTGVIVPVDASSKNETEAPGRGRRSSVGRLRSLSALRRQGSGDSED